MAALILALLLGAGGALLIGLSWHSNLQAAGKVISA